MEIRTNNACGCYRYTLATKLHRRQKKTTQYLFVGLLSTDTSVIRCFPGLSFAKETTSSTTMAKKGCQKFPWQNNQIENAKGELMPKTCKRIKLQFAKTILIFFLVCFLTRSTNDFRRYTHFILFCVLAVHQNYTFAFRCLGFSFGDILQFFSYFNCVRFI